MSFSISGLWLLRKLRQITITATGHSSIAPLPAFYMMFVTSSRWLVTPIYHTWTDSIWGNILYIKYQELLFIKFQSVLANPLSLFHTLFCLFWKFFPVPSLKKNNPPQSRLQNILQNISWNWIWIQIMHTYLEPAWLTGSNLSIPPLFHVLPNPPPLF